MKNCPTCMADLPPNHKLNDNRPTMNYELALALKNAGFPQKYHYDWQGISDFPASTILDKEHPEEWGVRISNPTLSELVEACGDGFTFIKRDKNWNGKYCWMAVYEHEIPMNCVRADGSTPEEAVARLYLALNKK